MFSGGDAYERFMGRWSRKLAVPFLQFANLRNGDSVLDVGSGTGAVAAAVAAVSPSSRIVGIDPAAGFVEFARARHGGDLIRFEVADAQHLPFADRSFARTLSLLNLNFIPDPGQALREMSRVTQPGGTVAAAVWDYGDGMEMLRVFWDEAVALDPSIDARDERHMPLCRRGELALLWSADGLDRVEEQEIVIELPFASFDDYWDPFLGGQGPAGVYVASLSEATRAALAARLRDRLIGARADGPFTLHARAWAVKGIVPA